jgi:lipoprotein-anchoring transpeptidase ErfK/SrfK
MGTRDSDGCIRLRNEDIVRLRPLVRKGMNVTITPDKAK